MNNQTMKKFAVACAAIAILLLGIAWMAGIFTEKVAPQNSSLEQVHPKETLTLTATPIAHFESVPAGIYAKDATLIASQVMARIEKVHVKAGDSVAQGQTLVTLESKGVQAQVAQAKAQVSAIGALQTEAAANLKRTIELRQQGLASSVDLDRANALSAQRDAELIAANQRLNELKANLEYSEIAAPISGRIVDRMAEAGDMAIPGQTLLSLYNPFTLQVEANVRESIAVQLKVGQEVLIKVDALGTESTVNISEIVPAADPNARSFIVKANLNFSERLMPGMFIRLLIDLGEERRLMLPQHYVSHFGQLESVWVVTDNGVQRRIIRTGNIRGDSVEVISGLIEGEKLTLGPTKQKDS